jgi:hypothetical protein
VQPTWQLVAPSGGKSATLASSSPGVNERTF